MGSWRGTDNVGGTACPSRGEEGGSQEPPSSWSTGDRGIRVASLSRTRPPLVWLDRLISLHDKEEVRGSNPRAPTSDSRRNRDSPAPPDPVSATILQPMLGCGWHDTSLTATRCDSRTLLRSGVLPLDSGTQCRVDLEQAPKRRTRPMQRPQSLIGKAVRVQRAVTVGGVRSCARVDAAALVLARCGHVHSSGHPPAMRCLDLQGTRSTTRRSAA
jgi:hypothetical protein